MFIVPTWPLPLPSLKLCMPICIPHGCKVSVRVRSFPVASPLITIWLWYLSVPCSVALLVHMLIVGSIFVSKVSSNKTQEVTLPKFHYFSFLNYSTIDVQISEYVSYGWSILKGLFPWYHHWLEVWVLVTCLQVNSKGDAGQGGSTGTDTVGLSVPFSNRENRSRMCGCQTMLAHVYKQSCWVL